MNEMNDQVLLAEIKKLMTLKERMALLLEQGLPAAFRQSGLDAKTKVDVLEKFRKTTDRQREHLQLLRQLADDVRKGGVRVH